MMTRATCLALLLASCSGAHTEREPVRAATGEHDPRPAEVAPALSPPPADAPSTYELDIQLRDASGDAIPLDIDRGHPTLISMFYGSCSTACPALIGYAKQVAAQTPADTRVLLVSFDAARDTPTRLRALIDDHELDARWRLAAASDSDARALAAVLGFKYRANPTGEYFHNSVLVALDREGRPIARQDGFGDMGELVTALSHASR